MTTQMNVLDELQKGWHWIPGWLDQREGLAGQAVLFRRELQIDKALQDSVLHISADTRYKLLVDGKRICVGPARGSTRQWFYDSVTLPHLAAGRHLIEVVVQRFFPSCSGATTFARTSNPGLTIVGTVGEHDMALSHENWRARELGELRLPFRLPFDLFLHNFEDVFVSDVTPGSWVRPQRLKLLRHFGVQTPWPLQPRMIPFAEETKLSASAVRHTEGPLDTAQWEAFFLRDRPITLPSKSRFTVELEFPVHSTAFLRLQAESRGESKVKMIYSEAYEKLPLRGANGRVGYLDHADKQRRDDRSNAGLTGPWDVVVVKGKVVYEPFWWRTFRFIRYEIETGDGEMRMESLCTTQTNYPFPDPAEWSDAGGTNGSSKMWEISLRTLRNCAFDGYSDCPFYEQLQYAADTRLQILFHYYVTGDDRLARQAILAFASSARPDGMIEARTPAHGAQVITGFALHWILMVIDHWEYYADSDLIRPLLPIVDGIFEFFARYTTARGLVEGLPKHYWSFVDWHDDWNATPMFDDSGVPVQGRRTGTFTYFTLFYAYTLRRATAFRAVRPGFGWDYEKRADTAISGARVHCFDGLYFTDTVLAEMENLPDHPGGLGLSQHCQIIGILVDAHREGTATKVLNAAVDPRNQFTSCSYTFQHYLLRAAAKVNLYDVVSEQVWDQFRVMIRKNLTTWEETPSISRSDCHAWACLPLYEFPAEVAGLTPATPGWGEVRFAPWIEWSGRLEASIAMGSLGKAKVSWNDDGVHGGKRVRLELPVERVIRVHHKGRSEVFSKTKVIEFSE